MNKWAVTVFSSILSLTACTRTQGTLPSDAKDAPKLQLAAQVAPSVVRIPTRRVALTFDDLGNTELTMVPEFSRAIIAQLQAADAPISVFANCRRITGAMLKTWRDAGATIGNHTSLHLSVEDGDGPLVSDTWWSNVTSCHEKLTGLLGEPPRYFRFPFLYYGSSPERRNDAAAKLDALGYKVAHVTAATTEWLLADYYDDALLGGDTVLAREIAARYVTHMVETLDAAEAMAKAKGVAPIPQITLFHVNRLAAEHLGTVLTTLKERGWDFISMEDALADPVYQRRDEYAGKCGCSWLARIEPPLKPTDDYIFGDYEKQIMTQFGPRVAALAGRGP